MTSFYEWLYLGQTQYDPDDLNKREKELAQLAWEEAQSSIHEGWKLVPDYKPGMIVKFGGEEYKIFALGDKAGTFDICHPTDIHRDRWLNVPPVHLEPIAAAPKFGEEE